MLNTYTILEKSNTFSSVLKKQIAHKV